MGDIYNAVLERIDDEADRNRERMLSSPCREVMTFEEAISIFVLCRMGDVNQNKLHRWVLGNTRYYEAKAIVYRKVFGNMYWEEPNVTPGQTGV